MRGRLLLFILLYSLYGHAQYAPTNHYLVDSLPYEKLEKYDKELIDSVLVIYHKTTIDTVKTNLLLYLTENLENPESWLPYNNLLLEHAKFKLQSSATPDKMYNYYKNILAGAYNNYGFYYNLSGKKDRALEYFLQSMTLLEEVQNKVGLSDVYNNLGLLYKNAGQTSRSLDFYFKCLKICEEMNDSRGKATSYNNLGMLFLDLQEFEKSEQYLKKALLEWQKLNNKRGISSTLNNLGLLYDKQNNFDLAIDYYKQALVWNEKTGDKEGIGTSLGNLGWLYIKTQQYTKAEEYFERGLTYRKAINDRAGIGHSYYNLGSVYRKMNKNQIAKNYGLQAFEIAKELGYPDLLIKTSILMFNIEKDYQNYREALQYHEIYVQMRDSVSSIQNRNTSIKKQYQYEFEIKEAELKSEQEKRELILNGEIKRQKLIFLVSIIGAIAFLVFSIILYKRVKLIRNQKQIIESQKAEMSNAFAVLNEKNKEILDSIHYARRIQNAVLTNEDFFKNHFANNHFILFKPKDIVSGDFYWGTSIIHEEKNLLFLAVCDCTGHGVPGAFMSLLSIGFLTEAISEKKLINPSDVFNYIRKKLITHVSKENQKDGFDGVLICYDTNNKNITYSAANSKPLLIRENKIINLDYDRMPVGIGVKEQDFKTYEISLKNGDWLYLYTDGYSDQFGGEKNKKIAGKKFRELIYQKSKLTPNEQKKELDTFFEEWKGSKEQIDDVCVIGIRF